MEIETGTTPLGASISKKLKHNGEHRGVGTLDQRIIMDIGACALKASSANHNEETLNKDLVDIAGLDGPTSVFINSDNANGSNSDLSFHDNENDGEDAVEDAHEDAVEDDSDATESDDTIYDYVYEDIFFDDFGDYFKMQAQFGNVNLPPGVEASVTWWNSIPSSNASITPAGPSQLNQIGLSTGSEASPTLLANPEIATKEAIASSSSSVSAISSSTEKETEENGYEVQKKYQLFKLFDVVDDFSDHHYNNMGFNGQQPPMAWTKKIQDEWRILENDLPDTIYVRAYEARMDLLRAVMIGPQGSPYHDGLFLFDVFFPNNYPDEPPMVYYYSGGLRLNPNLYHNGKVCLSLLNTWTGYGNEKWLPNTSTMLQVLVSIQALILNAKPFFNEPGYDSSYFGAAGERKSNKYNDEVFILSLKTMLYTLRRPPKHFEDLVCGHFCARAQHIMAACKAYIDGAPVGSVVDGEVPVPDGAFSHGSRSDKFKVALTRMMNLLASKLIKIGAKGCEQFLASC